MAVCQCSSKERQPRIKRTKPYDKVNAYTEPYSCEQILTLFIFLSQLALHSVFVVPALHAIASTVLWVMLAFFYAALLLIAYDYFFLTTFDPADPLIVQEELAGGFAVGELKFCLRCDSQVQRNSYHCGRCNRCTENFDHHCKFLNNCIGSRNYEPFFRLLLVYSCYSANAVAMASWTAARTFKDPAISFQGSVWGMITAAILSLLILIAVGGLLIFHCYITCYEGVTTLTHIRKRDPQSDRNNNNNGNGDTPPTSAQRLTWQNRFS